MAKLLSYYCRYLDDICKFVNLKNFGGIAKDIYDNTLLLDGSACSYKQDTFLGSFYPCCCWQICNWYIS